MIDQLQKRFPSADTTWLSALADLKMLRARLTLGYSVPRFAAVIRAGDQVMKRGSEVMTPGTSVAVQAAATGSAK